MTKEERIQAINQIMMKNYTLGRYDETCLEVAKAIEEAIGVDDKKMAIEIRKLDYHKIGLVDCAKLAKAISTNKEVIKIGK